MRMTYKNFKERILQEFVAGLDLNQLAKEQGVTLYTEELTLEELLKRRQVGSFGETWAENVPSQFESLLSDAFGADITFTTNRYDRTVLKGVVRVDRVKNSDDFPVWLAEFMDAIQEIPHNYREAIEELRADDLDTDFIALKFNGDEKDFEVICGDRVIGDGKYAFLRAKEYGDSVDLDLLKKVQKLHRDIQNAIDDDWDSYFTEESLREYAIEENIYIKE